MAEKPTQPPADVLLEIRPTLFVGLGGTGKEVMLRLRRRILQQSWGPAHNPSRLASISDFPVAGFLYFDTDMNEARESDRAAATDVMATAVQFGEGETLQEKVDVQYYSRELATKPLIREWFPQADLSRIDTSKGAGQVRAISRLLFFHAFDKFRNRIQSKGNQLRGNVDKSDRLEQLGFKTQPELRIVVIASSAGGTGSGSFLDAGFALREMEFGGKKAKVDLFLMLPGGFEGAGRERVFANTYAALSELEHVSRPNHKPRYVTRWVEHQDEIKSDKPYDDVFFFDTSNIASQLTNSANHVFDMMADILAEDFSNSEFSARKRSVAVNKQMHKASLFYPAMPEGVGQQAIGFSRLYSAMGQTVVASTGSLLHESTISKATQRMLEVFFGAAADMGDNMPTPDDRDAFMADHLDLKISHFSDFHEKLRPQPLPILEYGIVETLTRRDGGESIIGKMKEEIERKVTAIRNDYPDVKGWEDNVQRVYTEVARDIDGDIESGKGVGPRGAEVRQSALQQKALFQAPSGEKSLTERFYRRLDNREKGGFTYTVNLIELVRTQIEAANDGVVVRLRRAQSEYERLAGEQITKMLSEAKANLAVASRKMMNAAKLSEPYLGHAAEALARFAEYRLRAIACDEAAKLLTELSNDLGERKGGDKKGAAIRSTGLVGEFQAGYDNVRVTLDLLNADIKRVKDALDRPEEGMYVVVKGAAPPERTVSIEDAKVWTGFLEGEGGRRALFQKLSTNEGQLELISRLRSVAATKLQAEEAQIPPVADALRTMMRDDPANLKALFGKMLARSMPWIPASFEAFPALTPDQFTLMLAVDKPGAFKAEFGRMIEEVLPTIGAREVGYVESGIPGRIVCYCEMSGVPLDVLTMLRTEWREAYRRQQDNRAAFPLHNHRDEQRFPDPAIPRTADVQKLQQRLILFLKGVGYGLLTREGGGPGKPVENLPYSINMGGGEFQQVGSERTIRRRDFAPNHLEKLQAQIAVFESGLTPVKTLALIALFDHMARRAYAPRNEIYDTDKSRRIGGLGHYAALAVKAQLEEIYAGQEDSRSDDKEIRVENLKKAIGEWTKQVKGSLSDVDNYEANSDPDDIAEARAVDKRQVDATKFEDAVLEQLASGESGGTSPAPGGPQPPPPPPPLPYGPFFVAAAGGQRGPIPLEVLTLEIASGQLIRATLVFDQARAHEGWREAGLHPALAMAFPPAGGTGHIPPPPPMPAPPVVEMFYIAEGGAQRGPLDQAALLGEIGAGQLGPTAKVFSKSVGVWVNLSDHPAFADVFDAPPPPPPDA